MFEKFHTQVTLAVDIKLQISGDLFATGIDDFCCHYQQQYNVNFNLNLVSMVSDINYNGRVTDLQWS